MGLVKTVGLVLHPGRNCDSAMFTILKWASERKVTVLGLQGEADRIPTQVEEVLPEDLAKRADLMVSLGGDGTMLRAMRLSARLAAAGTRRQRGQAGLPGRDRPARDG